MKKMSKKCSTDQRFIQKRNTSYKIGTLVVKKIYHMGILSLGTGLTFGNLE